MKTIYFFSGLGADERVFQFLELKEQNKRYITWIDPLKDERLSEYMKRIADQIDKRSGVIFIGVSFGGIAAIELSKIIDVEKIIIISSIKNSEELPLYYKILFKLKFHKIISYMMLRKCTCMTNFLFGTKTKQEKSLLKNILDDTKVNFLKWSISQIALWKNKNTNDRIIHIHGTSDRLLPIRNISNAIIVNEGGHFMIINKAKIISQILNKMVNDVKL